MFASRKFIYFGTKMYMRSSAFSYTKYLLEIFEPAIPANFAAYALTFFGVIYHRGYRSDDRKFMGTPISGIEICSICHFTKSLINTQYSEIMFKGCHMLDKRISTPKRYTSLDPSIAAEHKCRTRNTDMQLFPLQTSVNFQFNTCTLKLVVKSAPSVPFNRELISTAM